MLPTQEDVAQLANVSTATVSRCLNDPSKVVQETRNRVFEAMGKLGYSPNFGAQFLASKRSRTFGAIVPTLMNSIFANMLQSFEKEISSNQSTMLVASSSYNPVVEAEQIRTLVSRGAEGLLLIGTHRDEEIYSFLNRRGVSYVIAWAYQMQSDRVFVGYDNVGAMRELAELVLSYGHRNLAMIAGISDSNDRAKDRVTGVFNAMETLGDPKLRIRVIEKPYTINDGAKGFAELMDAQDPPTVVLCGNDVLAAGAIQKAREMNIQVPKDVSITGFDDNDIASICLPPLTTVHFSHEEMGRQSATALLHHIKTGTQSESVELTTRIVKRQSLGPARTALEKRPD